MRAGRPRHALAIVLLYARAAPERYPRAAARFVERVIEEGGCTIGAVAVISAALCALPDEAAGEALEVALESVGLPRTAEVLSR